MQVKTNIQDPSRVKN